MISISKMLLPTLSIWNLDCTVLSEKNQTNIFKLQLVMRLNRYLPEIPGNLPIPRQILGVPGRGKIENTRPTWYQKIGVQFFSQSDSYYIDFLLVITSFIVSSRNHFAGRSRRSLAESNSTCINIKANNNKNLNVIDQGLIQLVNR